MPFDGITMHAALCEQREVILDSKIIKINQPKHDELVLGLRRLSSEVMLLISINPEDCRLHLTNYTQKNPPNPPNFCMVLRKYLVGGIISDISQKDMERIVEIVVQSRDEFMQPIELKLIIEIMGKHSNVILVNSKDNKIIDSIKKVASDKSRYRQILPGKTYDLPPVDQKICLLHVNQNDIMSIMVSAKTAQQNKTLSKCILDHFMGFCGTTAKEMATRAGIDPKRPVSTLSNQEITAISSVLNDFKKNIENRQFCPILYIDTDTGFPTDFWVFPLQSKTHYKAIKKTQINQVVDEFFAAKNKWKKLNSDRNNVINQLKKHLKKLNQNLTFLNSKLEKTRDINKFKLWGEILSANLYQLQQGLKEVTLPNFYKDGEDITIPLNNKISPAHNAQNYFKKYKKLQSTKNTVEKRIEKILLEIEYLENTFFNLENAETLEDLLEIKQELEAQGYLKSTHKNKKVKVVSNPYKFKSSDGFAIYVGKNNRQNDMLTLKKATPNDIWFHTKNIPGSHVILECGGQKVSEKALIEAATLAAYFSKARQGSNVPVDYTKVKHIKKPSGSKPGYVIYDHQKTLYVNPDNKILKELCL